MSLDDWRRTLDLDLTGAFLCLQHAGRRMVAQGRGGRLIAITSIHEHLPLRDSAAYGAAKGWWRSWRPARAPTRPGSR
jgi:NAD(P)-dependent dehydrogenase (short-subunit alcohol dehydrogenase family)